MTHGVSPPEDQGKIQVFVNMLLRHWHKAEIEKNSKNGIK